MQKDEAYHKYERFLTEVERKFASEIIGKSKEEQRAMLQLAKRIIESFTDLYGDSRTQRTLLNHIEIKNMPSLSMN